MKIQQYCSQVYFDDDPRANSDPALFRMADAKLRELLGCDPSELARQISPLNFAPDTLLAKLKAHAREGRAGLVCINRSNASVRIFWDSEADDCLSELMRLRNPFILGYLVFPSNGVFVAYPSPGEDEPANQILLSHCGRVITSPQVQAAEAMLKVTTLDEYSDWQDRYKDALIDPISFPNPETGLTGEAI